MERDRLKVKSGGKTIYDIVLRESFYGLGEELIRLCYENRKICVVTETKVAAYYLEDLKTAIEPFCASLEVFIFEEGEANKNLKTVEALYEHLILKRFDRKDVLLALGGGVVGDLTGFTAATYLRGIDFIQVPTTLLAQVDSSIGGKTGVDFLSYKNMVGAFHMPKLVYMNLSTLKTLPDREFHCGLGEIIKHGLIKDKQYLDFIEIAKEKIIKRDPVVLHTLIYKSLKIKKDVVERDPKEQGERALLNFGHTLGHAIEKQMNFSLLHGECVAIGSVAALYISKEMGNITEEEYKRYKELIYEFGYPKLQQLPVDEVVEITKSDKKMEQGKVKFIVLRQIGEAEIVKTVTDEMMKNALEELIS